MPNAPDCHDRDGNSGPDCPHGFHALDRARVFGAGGKYRTETDIVGPGLFSGPRLFSAVRGYADDRFRADYFSGVGKGKIVLSQVYAVGSNRGCDIGVVIDNEQTPGFAGFQRQLEAYFVNLPPGPGLVAILEEPDAASAGNVERRNGVDPEQVVVKNETQALDVTSQGNGTAP